MYVFGYYQVFVLTFKPEYYQTGYKLTTMQKIRMALEGNVKVFSVDLVGEGKLVDFFAFKCKDHGIVISMPTGHYKNLRCPYCPFYDGTIPKAFDVQKIKIS